MFKSALFKLTASYLSVLMLLSISFSFLVYNVATNEFSRRFEPGGSGVMDPLQPRALRINPEAVDYIREQVAQSEKAIITNLFFTNIFVLFLGGFLSYGLARWTLKPIEEAHQSLERFTADASHELRTPLTAMKSEIEVALKTNQLSKTLLKSNLEEIEKLTLLSESLLKIARQDKNIQKRPVNLKQVAKEAVSRSLAKAETKSILLESNLKNGQVNGDKEMLEELSVILIDNAIKYSSDKSKVVIKTGENYLSVADSGKGIKATELPYIFERFYRGEASRTSSGYGLGLSIAEQIAQLHGAKIEVQSQPNKGSTFTLTF